MHLAAVETGRTRDRYRAGMGSRSGRCFFHLALPLCHGRTRAIAAPSSRAFALLLDRVERGAGRKIGFLCGVVLGLSVYAYTSARVLPVALSCMRPFAWPGNGKRKRFCCGAMAPSWPARWWFRFQTCSSSFNARKISWPAAATWFGARRRTWQPTANLVHSVSVLLSGFLPPHHCSHFLLRPGVRRADVDRRQTQSTGSLQRLY